MEVPELNLEMDEYVIWMREKENLVTVLTYCGLVRKVLSQIGVKIVS